MFINLLYDSSIKILSFSPNIKKALAAAPADPPSAGAVFYYSKLFQVFIVYFAAVGYNWKDRFKRYK
jgi:hypothetical protein